MILTPKKTTLSKPLKFTFCCNFGPPRQFWPSQRTSGRHACNFFYFFKFVF